MTETLLATTFMAAVLTVSGCAVARSAPHPSTASPQRRGIAVYALSKGKGVPPATAAALQKVRAMFESLDRADEATHVTETRVGIEGETRLCVEITDADTAQQTLEQLRALSRGVELMNVVEEPCQNGD